MKFELDEITADRLFDLLAQRVSGITLEYKVGPSGPGLYVWETNTEEQDTPELLAGPECVSY